MKTSLVSFALASAVAAASAAVPTVESVSVAQDAVGGKVTVSYRLTDADAIVTINLQTNVLSDATGAWVSVGDKNQTTLVGDVNQLVTASDTTVRTACWFPDREPFAGKNLGPVRAVVRPWTEKQPPDYLVLDLEATNARRYYTSADALPDGGLTNKIYRRSRLVMRRIPAAGQTFRMGATPEEQAHYGTKEGSTLAVGVPHLVSFTNDYYMSIYHLTQGQTYCVTNSSVQTTSAGYKAGDCYVLGIIPWANVRGSGAAGADYDWPKKGHAVAPNSVLGLFRARTGVELDLPTDAQWEYACRAGTSSYWSSGEYASDNVPEIAVCSSGSAYYSNEVGTKKPNPWGLYDMHGLAWDYCLDWYSETDYVGNGEPVVEPVGPESSDTGKRVRRGGSYGQTATMTRSGCREQGSMDLSGYNGYRLIAPIGLKW